MLQIDDVFLKKSQLSFVISEAIVESSLDLFISESISSCKSYIPLTLGPDQALGVEEKL